MEFKIQFINNTPEMTISGESFKDAFEKSVKNKVSFEFANLKEVDLSGTMLRGAYLYGANLTGADLSNTDLSFSNLSKANLFNSLCHNTIFNDSFLCSVDAQYANFSCAKMKKSLLNSAIFLYANLDCIDLTDAFAEKAIFIGASLQLAKMHGTYLVEADLRGADIDYASLSLSCKSFNVNVDKRIAVEMFYFACNWLKNSNDNQCLSILKIPEVKELANQFHNIDYFGKI